MLANKLSSLLPKSLSLKSESIRSLTALCGRRNAGAAVTSVSQTSSSPSSLYSQLQTQQQSADSQYRSYVSRAHPKPIPEFSVPTGLQMVLDSVEERKKLRAAKWERNKDERRSKGIEDVGEYRNQNETIELAVNLNVDPRRPGQALRGSIVLPHGTGKTVSCIVFTSDPSTIDEAKSQGHEAGGEELVDRILAGETSLDSYQRALATKESLPLVQKQLARLLGPRGLMPNPKTNTVFDEGKELLDALREQSSTVTYRTESGGIVHFPIGKGNFSSKQLTENLQVICQAVQDAKPEQYGRGKKPKSKGGGAGTKGNSKKQSKNVKYWLKAHLTATQGKGSVRLDLRTVDPASPFFMKEPE
eukprot:jgi/Psemu1/326719/estExt_fgenesh1_pg.C_4510001